MSTTASVSREVVLDVRNLTTAFSGLGSGRTSTVVNAVSFDIARGESLALVGESGSGKSMTALSILGLVPPSAEVTSGEVLLSGRDLRAVSQEELRKLRGRSIGFVSQDPGASLSPVLTIRKQFEDTLRQNTDLRGALLDARIVELLSLVGIADGETRLRGYAHELSGGQKQRVAIAIAIACEPQLLIADEPTTALDVTIQAQIVALLLDLQRRLGMSMLWVTHDLALVSEIAGRVCVFYAGSIVEAGPTREVIAQPQHPYTRALLHSMPRTTGRDKERLAAIPGSPPLFTELPRGCSFSPRCPSTTAQCFEEAPTLTAQHARNVACFNAGR